MIELACPESCQYLRSAREQAILRERELQIKEKAAAETPAELRLLEAEVDINPRMMPLVYAVDQAIVKTVRETFRDIEDLEALAALDNAIKNFETESTGLIYEHRTSSPRVQAISDNIRSMLEAMAKEAGHEDRLTRSDMIEAIKYVRYRVRRHLKRAEKEPGNSRGFIRQVSLFYPWSEEATKPLII
jgi:hypothetical protein